MVIRMKPSTSLEAQAISIKPRLAEIPNVSAWMLAFEVRSVSISTVSSILVGFDVQWLMIVVDALLIILKARSDLCYQQAFLSHEIDSIFANAPITRAPDADHDHADDEGHAGKRKPVEGDCPICVFEMEPGEELVWCKAACGQNFHKQCFDQWRASKRGARLTCVYCRSEWQEEGMTPSRKPAPGSLASLKEHAPKKGSYKNIGHLPMYQVERDEKD